MPKPRAVIFDVFGTMCVARKFCHPYRPIYAKLPDANGDINIAREMTKVRDISLRVYAEELGLEQETIQNMEAALAEELASIELFPETTQILRNLQGKGVKLALASNLTTPHRDPVLTLLPVEFDVYAWSFEVGAVKPSPRIYQYVLEHLGLPTQDVVMVGDSLEKDCLAPQALGLRTYHVDRERNRDLATFYTDFFQ